MALKPWEEIDRRKAAEEYFSKKSTPSTGQAVPQANPYDIDYNQLLGSENDTGYYGYPANTWHDDTFSDKLAFADTVKGLGSLLGWGGKGLNAVGYANPMLASTIPSGVGPALAGSSWLADILGTIMGDYYIGEQNKSVSDMFTNGFPDDWSVYNYSPYADYTQPSPARPTPMVNTPFGQMSAMQYYTGNNPFGTYGGGGETTYDGYNHDGSDIGLGGYVGPVNMGALREAGGLGGGDTGYSGGGWGGPSGDWSGDAWGDSWY